MESDLTRFMGDPKLGLRVDFQVGMCRQSESDSFWMHTVIGQEEMNTIWKMGNFSRWEEKLFFHEGGQALEEVAQTHVASPSSGLLKTSGQSLEQLALVRLTFEQGFELNDCQRSLLTFINVMHNVQGKAEMASVPTFFKRDGFDWVG